MNQPGRPRRQTFQAIDRRAWLKFAGASLVGAASMYAMPAMAEEDESPFAPRLDREIVTHWQFGLEIVATGLMKGIVATAPVPSDWPEQKVAEVERDVTKHVKRIAFDKIDGGVLQMSVFIPTLEAGETARAVVTYEVRKRQIEGPTETIGLKAPQRGAKEFAKYLGASPFIEIGDEQIKEQAAKLAGEGGSDWEKAERAFDWVRANIKYQFAPEISPAVTALETKQGDCEELTSLVIAFCRLQHIPARSVWVPEHCYPEFYLVDPQGRGHWYPCQAAGEARDFGRMVEDRPILQKGDSFTVKGEKAPQRYLHPRMSAKRADDSPQLGFVMKRVDWTPAEESAVPDDDSATVDEKPKPGPKKPAKGKKGTR